MTLQELKFIIALAREKHFGKAAKAVHVSQPTLSVAIRKLERKLGVTIFERDINDVRVTPLGKDIVERAKRVMAEVEGIKQTVEYDQDQLAGTLRLGAIYTIAPYLLPGLIIELNKIAPQMSIEIQEGYTANLKEKLDSGDLDAIIVSLPFTLPGAVTKTLYKEPFVVMMPYDHPLAAADFIHEKMLSQYNVLLLGEGHCFRDQVISSCPTCFVSKESRSGVNWRTAEGSSLETIRHMVAANMGLTILPVTAAIYCPYKENLLTMRPLKGSEPMRKVGLAWRKSFPRIKAIDAILQAVSDCNLMGAVK
ncbi:MAG: LysR substrate-binding domain-containing protein [Gammaproteobacteria bacterium]